MKIIAGTIVRNAEKFIESMISSMSWVDEHYIVDDHSNDKTASILKKIVNQRNNINLVNPWFSDTMFSQKNGVRNASLEQKIRNEFVDFLFTKNPDAVILIDADELMSYSLKKIMVKAHKTNPDSVALECHHLLDISRELYVYPQEWNNVKMVDPHVRILFKKKYYQPGEWKNSPDCFIKHTNKTLCLNGLYHYHMRYWNKLNKLNYTFKHLPKNMSKILNINNTRSVLYKSIPSDILQILDKFYSK